MRLRRRGLPRAVAVTLVVTCGWFVQGSAAGSAIVDPRTAMTVSTVAGGQGNGPASSVDLRIQGVAASPAGLYVLDQSPYPSSGPRSVRPHPVLRLVDPQSGAQRVVADERTLGFAPQRLLRGGYLADDPVAAAPDGSVYWVDNAAGVVLRRDATGAVTTIAGSSSSTFSNASCVTSPQDAASWPAFADDIAVGTGGQVYVSDSGCHRVSVIQGGRISPFAGSGDIGATMGNGDGGPATSAPLSGSNGIELGPNGSVYIADLYEVRKVDATGVISTVAGGHNGGALGDGGPARSATMQPSDMISHPDGSLDIAEADNRRFRRVDPAGIISTIATGVTASRLSADPQGHLYWGQNELAPAEQVQELLAPGVVTRVVGTGVTGVCCHSGDGGRATDARLSENEDGVALDAAGNLYLSDGPYIRKVDAATGLISTVAGQSDLATSTAPAYQVNGPGRAVTIYPRGLAVDPAGGVLFADTYNNRIARLDLSGLVTTVVGATEPNGLVRDSAGALYFSSQRTAEIVKVSATGQSSCYAACPGASGYDDGRPATQTALDHPLGLALDPQGDLFVVEHSHRGVRRITPDGLMSTVIGGDPPSANGGRYPLADRQLYAPVSITAFGPDDIVASDGNLLVSVVNGVATTLDPSGPDSPTDGGDGGPVSGAHFASVDALIHDASGRIYLSDSANGRVRRLTPPAPPAPMSPIQQRYAALGGQASFLGAPIGVQYAVPGGLAQDYQHGQILWSSGTAAHEVHGLIDTRYRTAGAATSVLGLPVTDETITADRVGRFNNFVGGSIYWSPASGAHVVRGAIRTRWAALGAERGRLGYPTSDETAVLGGRQNTFQHGTIFWNSRTGALTVSYR